MPLKKEAWEKLAVALVAEPKIMGSRITADGLKKLDEDNQAVLLQDNDDEIVGFMAYWKVPGPALEMGAIWVKPELRGTGLGNKIAAMMVELVQRSPFGAFAITTNPACVSALKKAGMQVHTDWRHPFVWDATCGPCDTVSENDKPNCPKRDTKCVLLITTE